MAQVGLFEGGHADLAAPLSGSRAKGAVPPLLLGREDGNAMLDAQLATAIFEAPTGFVAHRQGASRAGKSEGLRAKAPVA